MRVITILFISYSYAEICHNKGKCFITWRTQEIKKCLAIATICRTQGISSSTVGSINYPIIEFWHFFKNYSTFLVLQRRFLGKICDDREKFNLDESAHSMLRRGFSLKTKHFGFCQAISSSFSGSEFWSTGLCCQEFSKKPLLEISLIWDWKWKIQEWN